MDTLPTSDIPEGSVGHQAVANNSLNVHFCGRSILFDPTESFLYSTARQV